MINIIVCSTTNIFQACYYAIQTYITWIARFEA